MLRVLETPTSVPGSYSPGEEDVAMFGLGQTPRLTAEERKLAKDMMDTGKFAMAAYLIGGLAVTGLIVWGIVKLAK